MIHRGPDDGGIFVNPDGSVGLVHRRLAIIDLSAQGHQPMATLDGRFTIVHNGEVYNYQELRAQLLARGYQLRSQTDTEVILYAYVAWQQACLPKLRGMYAFAIWDNQQRQLLLARDRLGIKPLYYALVGEDLVFGSELHTLQASALLSRTIDTAALRAYLMLGAVPAPLTIYRDIRVLPPGTYMLWQEGRAQVARYWHFPLASPSAIAYQEAVAQVKAELLQAVQTRLVSDVPLGAFLSGGLDSSTVVALMKKAGAANIRTCSMSFQEAAYNEAPYARIVAQAFATEHYERVVTLQDLEQEWERIVQSMDQPTVDGVNTYFVAKTAREAGLTVALSGLGGDELFGGYPNTFDNIPKIMRLLHLMARLPGSQRWAGRLLQNPWLAPKFRKLADALGRPSSLASAYLAARGLFAPSEVQTLLAAPIENEAREDVSILELITQTVGPQEPSQPEDYFYWIAKAELLCYTAHQLLRDSDVMSMAHSLEVRVPLLDHLLVERVLQIPAQHQRGAQRKALLCQAMAPDLPAAILQRKEKMGFTFPFQKWLGAFLVKRPALRPGSCPYLENRVVQKIMRSSQQGKVAWYRPWALLVWSEWARSNAIS